MFQLRLADLNILVKNNFSYVEEYCKDYIISNGALDFEVEVTKDEILAAKECNINKLGISPSPEELEAVVIHRKIADKLFAYNCFMMHCVVIEMDGVGIAFVAKSGVGKSTHAALWKKLFGEKVTIINGDKPLVRLCDDKLFAYGTPWSGKERLQTNKSCHLQKICFLERSGNNECVRLFGSSLIYEAMKHIYTDKYQDTLCVLRMLNSAKVTTEFYLLRCNMDISAAEVAYKVLMS